MGKWEMARLGDVCDSKSSNIAQKDLENNNGTYPRIFMRSFRLWTIRRNDCC